MEMAEQEQRLIVVAELHRMDLSITAEIQAVQRRLMATCDHEQCRLCELHDDQEWNGKKRTRWQV